MPHADSDRHGHICEELPMGLTWPCSTIASLTMTQVAVAQSAPIISERNPVEAGIASLSATPQDVDRDQDGIDDNYENSLLRHFAPVFVPNADDDSRPPTSASWFLRHSDLWDSRSSPLVPAVVVGGRRFTVRQCSALYS
jgi:hypothetical protein